MANIVHTCSECGNRWPDNQQGKEHVHLTAEERKKQLKLKYRTRKTGWDKKPNPRTNGPRAKSKTLRPRRKAYGPF